MSQIEQLFNTIKNLASRGKIRREDLIKFQLGALGVFFVGFFLIGSCTPSSINRHAADSDPHDFSRPPLIDRSPPPERSGVLTLPDYVQLRMLLATVTQSGPRPNDPAKIEAAERKLQAIAGQLIRRSGWSYIDVRPSDLQDVIGLLSETRLANVARAKRILLFADRDSFPHTERDYQIPVDIWNELYQPHLARLPKEIRFLGDPLRNQQFVVCNRMHWESLNRLLNTNVEASDKVDWE